MLIVKVTALAAAASLAVADAAANIGLPALGHRPPPHLLSLGVLALAAVLAVVAYVAHVFGRLDAKVDLLMDLCVGRLEDLEEHLRTWATEPAADPVRVPDTAVRPLTTAALSRPGTGQVRR